MSMASSEKLESLREKALFSIEIENCVLAVNDISKFGEKALPTLTEILTSSTDSEVIRAARSAIDRIKERKKN
jgi:hypothetical protein